MNCHWLAGALLPFPLAWQGFFSPPSPPLDGSCLGLSCPVVLTEKISHQARSRTADTRDRPPRAALIVVLRASVDEAEHLLTNAWTVSLYQIDYLRFTSGQEALREADFASGYEQVLRPLMSPASRWKRCVHSTGIMTLRAFVHHAARPRPGVPSR